MAEGRGKRGGIYSRKWRAEMASFYAFKVDRVKFKVDRVKFKVVV